MSCSKYTARQCIRWQGRKILSSCSQGHCRAGATRMHQLCGTDCVQTVPWDTLWCMLYKWYLWWLWLLLLPYLHAPPPMEGAWKIYHSIRHEWVKQLLCLNGGLHNFRAKLYIMHGQWTQFCLFVVLLCQLLPGLCLGCYRTTVWIALGPPTSILGYRLLHNWVQEPVRSWALDAS